MQAPLHPRLKRLLWLINLGSFNPDKPLNETRWITNAFMKFMNWYAGFKFPDFYSVKDTSFQSIEGHTIKLKVFNPVQPGQVKLPVWVYLHGGGFCHGGYDTRNNFCKAIATRVNCVVFSVSYRLAPENKFPAAPNDCYEAINWIAKNAEQFGGDGNRLAVGGESAGGNLSAVMAIMSRDKGGPKIAHQTLLYPVVDAGVERDSIKKFGSGFMLDKDLMDAFHGSYIPESADKTNPYLSPLYANHKDLAPALVITAGYDPLVDEGDLYAEKLKQAGVPVVHKRYDNMIHDFTMLLTRKLPEARDSVDLIVQEVKKAFAAPSTSN
jgi:acetyl esterase